MKTTHVTTHFYNVSRHGDTPGLSPLGGESPPYVSPVTCRNGSGGDEAEHLAEEAL